MTLCTEQISYVNDSIVIFNVAEDLKSAQFPLSTLRGIDRGDFKVAMDRGGFVVDEFDGTLLQVVSRIAAGPQKE
jgi:hypothetical protein